MEVDNGYVARPGAAPTNAKEVDRPGVKIAVAQRTRDCSASSNQECRGRSSVAEVTKMDMKVENGKVAAFRTRVSLSFKYGG